MSFADDFPLDKGEMDQLPDSVRKNFDRAKGELQRGQAELQRKKEELGKEEARLVIDRETFENKKKEFRRQQQDLKKQQDTFAPKERDFRSWFFIYFVSLPLWKDALVWVDIEKADTTPVIELNNNTTYLYILEWEKQGK